MWYINKTREKDPTIWSQYGTWLRELQAIEATERERSGPIPRQPGPPPSGSTAAVVGSLHADG
jgi:hypothetical protein